MDYTEEQKREWALKMAKLRAAKKEAKKKMSTLSVTPYERKKPKIFGHNMDAIARSLKDFSEYKVERNSFIEYLDPPSPDSNSFVFRHREYIADVLSNSTSALDVQEYPINPGLTSSFPYLSQLAQNFSEYRIRGMVYEFKSMSSDAVLSTSTSSALGTVIMATDYNAADGVFPDKKTMENYQFANSSKPSCSFYHPVECKPGHTPLDVLYTRTVNPLPTGSGDLRLYDLGTFQIASQGQQNNGTVIGELWVTYEVELFKPRMYQELYSVLSDHWQLGTISTSNPLGVPAAAVLQSGSTLGTVISGPSFNLLNFPPTVTNGKFLVVYVVYGNNGTTLANPLVTPNTSCTIPSYWNADTANAGELANNAVSTRIIISFVVYVQATGLGLPAVVTWGTAGTFSSSTTGDLWITELNANIQS